MGKQVAVTEAPAFGDVVYFVDSARAFKVVRSALVVDAADQQVPGAQICDAERFADPEARSAGPFRPLSELYSTAGEEA